MTFALFTLLLAQTGSGMAAAPGCSGADPAITNVTKARSTNAVDVNRYTLTVTVTNLGSKAQKASVLQSVDIFLDGTKNGEKGVPPLRAGQTYAFPYDVLRAVGARRGSTTVRLHLAVHAPSADAGQNCSTSDDDFKIRI